MHLVICAQIFKCTGSWLLLSTDTVCAHAYGHYDVFEPKICGFGDAYVRFTRFRLFGYTFSYMDVRTRCRKARYLCALPTMRFMGGCARRAALDLGLVVAGRRLVTSWRRGVGELDWYVYACLQEDG